MAALVRKLWRSALVLFGLLMSATVVGAPPADARDARADILVNQFGEPVPAGALKNHFLLVYFGFTSCPDLCPAALTKMTSTLNLLGADGATLLPLFVTVDPARDTVAVLRSYAAHFHPRLIALTGTPAAIEDAAQSFNVQSRRGPATASGQYAVDHSVLLYVADREGRVVQVFHPQQSAAEIAAAIRTRLAANGPVR